MPTRYFLGADTSDLTVGSREFNWLAELPANIATWQEFGYLWSVANSTTAIGTWFVSSADMVSGATGNYTITYRINSGNTNYYIKWQLHRVNSSGTVQTSSSVSATQQATNALHTQTFTSLNLGTWSAGDRLRIDMIVENTATMGGSGNIRVKLLNDTAEGSYIDTPFSEVVDPTAALTTKLATTAPGTFVVTLNKTPTGQSATAAAGTLGVEKFIGLDGLGVTAASGTLGVTLAKTPTGQPATTAPGTFAPALDVPLTGLGVTGAADVLTTSTQAAPLSELVDTFATLDTTTNWWAPSTFGGATATVEDGKLRFTGLAAEHNAILEAKVPRALPTDNSRAYIQLVTPLAATGGNAVEAAFLLYGSSGPGDQIGWRTLNNGTISAFTRTGWTLTSEYSVASSTHIWLGLRRDATTLYWDTAPDNNGVPGTWTQVASKAMSTLSWSVDNNTVRIWIWSDGIPSSDPGFVEFDGLNTTGTVSDRVVPLTGLGATAASGTLDVTFDDVLTPKLATAASGTLGVTLDKALTTQLATVAGGTLGVTLDKALTTQLATVAAGTFEVEKFIGIDGLGATAASGTLNVTFDDVLTPKLATTASGTLGVTLAKTPTGQSATAAAGTFVVEKFIGLDGLGATAASGTLGVTLAKPLATQLATIAGGTLAPAAADPTAALTTKLATVAGGTLVPGVATFNTLLDHTGSPLLDQVSDPLTSSDPTRGLTTKLATAAGGSFGVTLDKALTGLSAAAAHGNLGIQTDGGVVLIGFPATTTLGTVGVTLDKALTGQSATAAHGSLGVTLNKVLTSQTLAAAQGAFSVSLSRTLTGQSTAVALGTLTPGAVFSVALTGQSAATAQGSVTPDRSSTVALTGHGMGVGQGIVVREIPFAPTVGAGATFGNAAFGTTAFGGDDDVQHVTLTGLSMTAARGDFSGVPRTHALTGQVLQAQGGGVQPFTGTITVTNMTGRTVSMTFGALAIRYYSESEIARPTPVPLDVTSVDVPVHKVDTVVVPVDSWVAEVPVSTWSSTVRSS